MVGNDFVSISPVAVMGICSVLLAYPGAISLRGENPTKLYSTIRYYKLGKLQKICLGYQVLP